MEPEIVQRLLDLNRQFYQTFALQFSATRQRLQPGVKIVLPELALASSILDLGCGNGRLIRELARLEYKGKYTGLDFSQGLLEEARRALPPGLEAVFSQADLSSDDWQAGLPVKSFQVVLALAVLHHIPSASLRRQILRKVHDLLAPGGLFILSNWQFLSSPRLRGRIQPWEAAGLSETQVEPGDYLLDWRQGDFGLRYVHHFSPQELQLLASETAFVVEDSFLSDGENQQLSLYQKWTAAADSNG